MRRRPRPFVGQEWAQRDLRWIAAFATALFLTAFYPMFIWVALAIMAAAAFRIAVYLVRRRRREQANADAPFWADRIED